MINRHLFSFLLILLLCKAGTAQSFLPVCENFGIEDYNEDAEFRCAASDNKGTTYFGTNFGVLIFRGEKKSSDKSWEFLLLPHPDIVLSMFMDTSANRLYVGAQNDFGYFDLTTFNDPHFVSLKTLLPSSSQQTGEAWHVNRIGAKTVFHTIHALLVYDGVKLEILPAPEQGIFHNVFAIEGGRLLINALDKGWFLYNGSLKTASSPPGFPVDKCYAVLPSLKKDKLLFFFRNAGTYEVSSDLSAAAKISSPQIDQLFSEAQLYGAEFNAEKNRLIVATLNKGALIFSYSGSLSESNLLSETQLATNILSAYGLYTDPLKNTWILGKSNLSRLPSDLSLVHRDFRGITVKSITIAHNTLYVAATNGLFSLQQQESLFSGITKIAEGSYSRVCAIQDTVYAFTANEIIQVAGNTLRKYPSPVVIHNIAPFNGKLCIATEDGVYKDIPSLLKDQPLLQGKNCSQLIGINNSLYVLAEDFGIIELGKQYQAVKEYGLNSDFTSTQNTKLFSENEHLIISNLLNTYCIDGGQIRTLNKNDVTRIWLDKPLNNGDQVEFEIDRYNNTTIKLKHPNDSAFIIANSFMSLVDVNDAEYFEGNYYLAAKNGLYISPLITSKTEEAVHIFRLSTDSSSYSPGEEIDIPYGQSKTINVFCALNSFYNTFDNTAYSYRLSGEGEKWTTTPFSNFQLNKLSWGEHTLEVKASYGNGQESKTTFVRFTILKPWWATWWAVALWILFFILFIYLIVQISVYRLKQSKVKLEEIVKERTAEIVLQKNEIEEQKEEIEHKNLEITDSINYAQRIQSSLLKGEEKLVAAQPGAFVLYLPKDIVSGDFYWFTTIKHYQLIVVADCTGHGVPGAFMSMLGVSKLNEIAARNIFMPDQLLHELNHLIVETLGQHLANSDSRDGMDAAVICIDKQAGKMYYAGANRPLLIVNKADNSFSEIKATKLPVGGGQYGENREYELHELELSSNLVVYMTTDGYADQFGGPKGKKFMTKQLNQLLTAIAHLEPAQQKERLSESYLAWRSNYEQVDDVCVIGIRV